MECGGRAAALLIPEEWNAHSTHRFVGLKADKKVDAFKKTSYVRHGQINLGNFMKNNFPRTLLIGISGVVMIAATLAARGQTTPWYVRADLGGTIARDTELKEFFGPGTGGGKVTFDPGVRFAYGGGYRVTDFFAVEVQSGVMANSIKSISGATTDDATFSNVPLLFNLRFEGSDEGHWSPYFGGGLGPCASIIDIQRINIGGTIVKGSQSDAVLAYQAFAGLRYRITEHIGLALEYHYFGSTQASWDGHALAGQMRFGGIETHAASLAFDYRF
jgi:opacity protein-like surface antigen